MKKIILLFLVLALTACSSNNNKSEVIKEIAREKPETIQVKEYPTERVLVNLGDIDLDGDGHLDNVFLYHDNLDIILRIKNSEVKITSLDSLEDIYSESYEAYTFDLINKGKNVLVGITNNRINKYGSAAVLECYNYTNSDEILLTWSSEVANDKEVLFDSWDEENNTIEVLVNNHKKELVIDNKDIEELVLYLNYINDNKIEIAELELGLTTEYLFYDYDYDGIKDLVTRTVTKWGATSIQDSYISVFEFTDSGVSEYKTWFRSSKEVSIFANN